jgi:hypothetical protein
MDQSDRRANQRYPISLEIEYKVPDGNGGQRKGLGRTIDISRRGLLLDISDPLPRQRPNPTIDQLAFSGGRINPFEIADAWKHRSGSRLDGIVEMIQTLSRVHRPKIVVIRSKTVKRASPSTRQ